MSALLLLALALAVVALIRAGRADSRAREAERKANLLREELLDLQAKLNLPPSGRLGEVPPRPEVPAGGAPGAGGVPAALPGSALPDPARPAPVFQPRSPWPEDQPGAVFQTAGEVGAQATSSALTSPAPVESARASLWGPEFSRARISVFGGALVLGGLAFTLRALGLPAWTLLLAVFAFGAVLYGTARLVPWPVSGALRGLGYGVTALGLGSLAQKFPDAWGPALVLLGLLTLSAALTWDGLRRREPLLGVMALGGASLSLWMLADDLGRASIPAAAAVFLLAAAALLGGRSALRDSAGQAVTNDPGAERPDHPQAWRAALTLTLGLTGLLPLGWLVAALSHVVPRADLSTLGEGELLSRPLLTGALHLEHEPLTGVAVWLGFSVLALLPALTLRRTPLGATDADDLHDGGLGFSGLRLSAAWASLVPQVLVSLALGVALSRGPALPPVLALSFLNLLVLGGAAWWAWQGRQSARDPSPPHPEDTLAGTLASSLTAGATGLAAAILLALLGARTQPTALAGLALSALLIGLHGRSRLWVWLGALGLAGTALWGLETAGLPPAWAPYLRATPALIAVAGSLRAARWQVSHPATPGLAWLAGLGSVVVMAALSMGAVWPVLGVVLVLAALLWRTQRGEALPAPVQHTLYWAALPAALVGSAFLLGEVGRDVGRLPLLLVAGGAALVILSTARRAGAAQPPVEAAALGLLIFALALWPDGTPHLAFACALVGLLAALLPLKLAGTRVPALLALGALATILSHVAWLFPLGTSQPIEWQTLEWLGVWALLLVSWLTLDPAGRAWLVLRLPGPPAAALRRLPGLSAAGQTWWFGLAFALAVSAGVFVWPHLREWWLLAGSGAALLLGLSACVRAARSGADPGANSGDDPGPRERWTAGLWLVGLAGLKGAGLDALGFSNPRAVAGLAVLVTGLSLLFVAVLAPRPRRPQERVGEKAAQSGEG